ncbi:MAG: transglycosylase domain-containing protein [Sphingomonadales bacterium]|nr:transglycosylase domain-containing protein [Sphingomonadales bacterium]
MADDGPEENLRYRIRRDAGGLWTRLRDRAAGLGQRLGLAERIAPLRAWFMARWRSGKLFRVGAVALGGFVLIYAALWLAVLRNLPSADTLVDYQPPLPTMVRGADGSIVYSYARERRVQLRYVDFPAPLIHAFLSAEDKNFFSHGGVDYIGLAQAVVDNLSKIGSGERGRGGSTITQQVAKNILVGNERSFSRKFKEMIVAKRIEGVLNKQQILELYLNGIPLGRQSFGVQAAARAYFGKDVGDLKLHEAAFLAILPKAPETYGRAKFADMALERRNWALDQMVKNNWASRAEADAAKAQPLGVIARRVEVYDAAVGYYVEEVRRRLIDKYGESAEDGPNSIYAGGLWVRTAMDPELQHASLSALRSGLLRYASGKPWPGPVAHLDLDSEHWQRQLAGLNKSIAYKDWRIGVVLQRSGQSAQIGFIDGSTAPLTGMADPVRAGDVVAASPVGNAWAVHAIPAVSGGMVAESPYNGRVLAMQGGFDSGLDSFNRATQAQRQPGSTIKPFVYATALDNGMTPATMVPDQQYCVDQGAGLGLKCFKNFGDEGGGGTHTMRWGLEQSRNLMTVHIAADTGMDKVTKTFERMGIGKYPPYLSFALGAGETTVGQMVNAYAALANSGVQYEPSLIDYVQDRNGKVIWRADDRFCHACNMAEWDGKPMPRLAPKGRQVMDSRTAYQVVHMLEGVIIRGTAVVLRDLNLPLFGKTGTTTGPTNVWFMGGSANIVGGMYMGYDQPRSLGGYAQGGTFAAPIMKQFITESRDRWDHTPFIAPAGVRLVRIDRASGQRVFSGAPSDEAKAEVIWEAFKPETEPQRPSRQEQVTAKRQELLDQIRRGVEGVGADAVPREDAAPGDFAAEQGGVY